MNHAPDAPSVSFGVFGRAHARLVVRRWPAPRGEPLEATLHLQNDGRKVRVVCVEAALVDLEEEPE